MGLSIAAIWHGETVGMLPSSHQLAVNNCSFEWLRQGEIRPKLYWVQDSLLTLPPIQPRKCSLSTFSVPCLKSAWFYPLMKRIDSLRYFFRNYRDMMARRIQPSPFKLMLRIRMLALYFFPSLVTLLFPQVGLHRIEAQAALPVQQVDAQDSSS